MRCFYGRRGQGLLLLQPRRSSTLSIAFSLKLCVVYEKTDRWTTSRTRRRQDWQFATARKISLTLSTQAQPRAASVGLDSGELRCRWLGAGVTMATKGPSPPRSSAPGFPGAPGFAPPPLGAFHKSKGSPLGRSGLVPQSSNFLPGSNEALKTDTRGNALVLEKELKQLRTELEIEVSPARP